MAKRGIFLSHKKTLAFDSRNLFNYFRQAGNILKTEINIQYMKKFYSRIRIFLLTFTFGLACVPFFGEIYNNQTTVSLDLPQVSFESPIIVYPKYTYEMGELPSFTENEWKGAACERGIKVNKVEKKLKKGVQR